MRPVAVVGVGETKFTGAQTKTEVELFAEAALDALNESGLKAKNIEALFWATCWGIFRGPGFGAGLCCREYRLPEYSD